MLRLESIKQVPEPQGAPGPQGCFQDLPSVHCKSPNPRELSRGLWSSHDFAGNWMVYLSSLIGLMMSDVSIHGVARTEIVAHVPISAQADLHHYEF